MQTLQNPIHSNSHIKKHYHKKDLRNFKVAQNCFLIPCQTTWILNRMSVTTVIAVMCAEIKESTSQPRQNLSFTVTVVDLYHTVLIVMYIMELPQPKKHICIFCVFGITGLPGQVGLICWYVKTIKLEQWPKPTQSGDTARKAADSIICDWKGICDTDQKQLEPIMKSQPPTRLHSEQYISKDCTELVVCNISYVSIYNMFNQQSGPTVYMFFHHSFGGRATSHSLHASGGCPFSTPTTPTTITNKL